jgi:bacterioferritin
MDKDKVISLLNRILELELAGVVRYTHYSFMVYGHGRIPIISWLRSQATESITHAHAAGEMVTHLGGHPSLAIGSLLETHQHDIAEILKESLAHETKAVAAYAQLLTEVQGKSILLEEYARAQIVSEEQHIGEIDKMMRKPGSFSSIV